MFGTEPSYGRGTRDVLYAAPQINPPSSAADVIPGGTNATVGSGSSSGASSWSKQPPAADPLSYGASLRQRLHATQETFGKEFEEAELAAAVAKQRYDLGSDSLRRKKVPSEEKERIANRLFIEWQEAQQRANQILNAKRSRLYKILEAPKPHRNVQISTMLNDARKASTDEAAAFVGSVVDQSVMPSVMPSLQDAVGAPVKGYGKHRGFYYDPLLSIYLFPMEGTSVAVHELGHWLEYRSSAIHDKCFAYYDSRAQYRTKM